jgi:hypothetical protein
MTAASAIAVVRPLVEGRLGGVPLDGDALRSLPKGPWFAGWRFRVDVASVLKPLDIVVDTAFPWSPPRLYLRRPPPLGTFPHLEADGFVCAVPGRLPADPTDPAGIVEYYLRECTGLMAQWDDPDWSATEIADEYLSYLGLRGSVRPIRSLAAPSAFDDHRMAVWRGATQTLIATDEAQIVTWLRNAGLHRAARPRFDHGIVLMPDVLPPPTAMPRTARELLELAETHGAGPALAEAAIAGPRPILVAVLLPTEPHPIMAAYEVPPAIEPTNANGRVRPVYAGFRPAKMPTPVVLARRLGGAVRVSPEKVGRLDAAWVHGRDANAQVAPLQEARVTVVGCGSLGSGVAVALAKAGVGSLDLVDHERLAPENAARHELGLSMVGEPKAAALADAIARWFPHMCRCEGHTRRWQTVRAYAPETLTRADLLVVTIGGWSDEGALEAWRTSLAPRPSAVFGWLEPHAAAAHAVMLPGPGACFGCGLDRFGQSRLKVADWTGITTTRSHPVCGGAFQPYGASALAHAHGLVTDAGLDLLLGATSTEHRIWSGAKRVVEREGGRWSKEWTAFAGEGVDRGGTFERSWARDEECVICGAK